MSSRSCASWIFPISPIICTYNIYNTVRYQKFEYAVGHWLQKATEHVLGCVLCSPGCFSLFRGSALIDDNVMRKYVHITIIPMTLMITMSRYATLPTQPRHHIQFDQGEDRWLCTLLLQRGWRVEYSAASDSYTGNVRR